MAKRSFKLSQKMTVNRNPSLVKIENDSPDIPGYGGGQWAMYSIACCWWTTFPEDLGVHANGIPCCPHCGSVLMQAPLGEFIAAAEANPDHYGLGGLETFAAAHSRNAMTCHKKWSDYASE